MHWLNNKEFYYTLEAEKIAEEVMKRQPVPCNDERDGSPDTIGAASNESGTSTPAVGVSNGIINVGSDPAIDRKQALADYS